ncbi:hypothetical protein ACHAXT_007864 [Thalassiosira profunda]
MSVAHTTGGGQAAATSAPQCTATEREGGGDPTRAAADVDGLNIGGCVIANIICNADCAGLRSLADDVLFDVLLFCGPTDVEESLKLVNRRLHAATSLSPLLWREYCRRTGKTLGLDASRFANHSDGSSADFDEPAELRALREEPADVAHDNLYRTYYFRNPCVPVDFASIQEAIHHCARTPSPSMRALGDESSVYSEIGTVVLLPGVYDERIYIKGERWEVGQACNKGLAIRAAFPQIGATLSVQPPNAAGDDAPKDHPCIAISTCDEDALRGVQKGISVRLSHLQILHSAPGADIWAGNAAVTVEGPRANVVIDSCVLQSDSGRGLVATNQSVTEVYRTSIVDCAATGVYLGDIGSRARLSGCNVARNGFGNQRAASEAVPGEPVEAVPPGHSGVYVESSMMWIDDCLVAGNCLTGLSVVRGGFVSLSGSDVTENGHTNPILIEDAHDVRDANRLQGVSIRGGVVEGPARNNYTSLENDSRRNLFQGGVVREGASSFCHNIFED